MYTNVIIVWLLVIAEAFSVYRGVKAKEASHFLIWAAIAVLIYLSIIVLAIKTLTNPEG